MDILKIDVGLLIWTLVTFAGLLLLLARFAFGPLRRILGEREASLRAAAHCSGASGSSTRSLSRTFVSTASTAFARLRDRLCDLAQGRAAHTRRASSAGKASRSAARSWASTARLSGSSAPVPSAGTPRAVPRSESVKPARSSGAAERFLTSTHSPSPAAGWY